MSSIVALVNEHIKEKFIKGLFTAVPAKVINVADLTSLQTVDVLPLIGSIDKDGVEITPSSINNVPVIMFGGGGALFSIPVKAGDVVLLVFSMKDISRWKRGNGAYTVADNDRYHNVNDAMAIPGLFTLSSNLAPDANDVVVKFSGSEIRIKSNGDIGLTSDSKITVKADTVIVDHTNSLELGIGAVEKAVLGDKLMTLYNGHVHPTGVGPSGTPVVPMAITDLSGTVKVK